MNSNKNNDNSNIHFDVDRSDKLKLIEEVRTLLRCLNEIHAEIQTEKSLIKRAEWNFFLENILRIRENSWKAVEERRECANHLLQAQLLNGRFNDAFIQVG